MASGVPVVLPAAGGVLEYANASNAWLSEPQPTAFAAAILGAAQGDRRRVAEARETALRFTWTQTTQRYFALYDELVAGLRRHVMAVDRRVLVCDPQLGRSGEPHVRRRL